MMLTALPYLCRVCADGGLQGGLQGAHTHPGLIEICDSRVVSVKYKVI